MWRSLRFPKEDLMLPRLWAQHRMTESWDFGTKMMLNQQPISQCATQFCLGGARPSCTFEAQNVNICWTCFWPKDKKQHIWGFYMLFNLFKYILLNANLVDICQYINQIFCVNFMWLNGFLNIYIRNVTLVHVLTGMLKRSTNLLTLNVETDMYRVILYFWIE